MPSPTPRRLHKGLKLMTDKLFNKVSTNAICHECSDPAYAPAPGAKLHDVCKTYCAPGSGRATSTKKVWRSA